MYLQSDLYCDVPLGEDVGTTGSKLSALYLSWCVGLVLSVALGIASIKYEWTGIQVHVFGLGPYITVYPPLVISTFFTLWFGFLWGFIPAYLSTFILAIYSGMPESWSLIFAFADPLGLLVLAYGFKLLPLSLKLNDFHSIIGFVGFCFIGALLGSVGSFIWSYTNDVEMHDAFRNWQGWWLGAFLQSVFINGPLLFVLGPFVLKWKEEQGFLTEWSPPSQKSMIIYFLVILLISFLFIFIAGNFAISDLKNELGVEGIEFGTTVIESFGSLQSIIWISFALLFFVGLFGYVTTYNWTKSMDGKLSAEKKAKEIAQKSAQLKSSFLSNMSHEVRTPMNAILGFTDLLKRKNLDPEVRKVVESINLSGANLLTILNDVLDISDLESGKISIKHDDFDTFQLIEAQYTMRKFMAQKKGLEMVLRIEETMPRMVVGDQLRISQVLGNLLDNAIKFTESGEIQLIASGATLSNGQHELQFEIKDTGPGIEEEHLEVIFESFNQVNNRHDRTHGGTGLGLTISRNLLHLMGGNMTVNSKVNIGSSFIVNIPVGMSLKKPKLDTKEVSLSGKRRRVLLVEDNEMNQLLARRIFKKHGIEWKTADNGEEAIAFLKKEDFDVVLLDLQMPVLDGYETLKKIRSELDTPEKKIQVVVMSAAISPDRMDELESLDCQGFIPKPFSIDELITLLNEIEQASSGN